MIVYSTIDFVVIRHHTDARSGPAFTVRGRLSPAEGIASLWQIFRILVSQSRVERYLEVVGI